MTINTLIIDTNAWQNNSVEWLRQREQKWPIIEKWFKESWDDSSFDKGAENKAYKHFYLTGEVHARIKFWMILAILHPEPSVANIRQLIKLNGSDYDGPGIITGDHYHTLIDLGIVEPQTLDNIFIAFAGDSYDETAQLRNFDPIEGVPHTLEKLVPKITMWFKMSNLEEVPIDLLIPYLASVMKYVTPENFEEAEFELNHFFKRLAGYKTGKLPKHTANLEKPVNLVKTLCDYYLSDHVNDCVRALAQQYLVEK
ncbi:MAG: hypothetical protein WBC60_01395 [Cognaticolwellia sp.]